MAGAQKSPNYLRENGYRCPTDPRSGFVQYAYKTDLTTFELIGTMPETFKDFNAFMGRKTGARKKWLEWYDVPGRLIQEARDDVPLLVDVGGGKGHDCLRFLEYYPDAGRLVLQDLEPVIASAPELPDTLDTMAYDFFTPQPVKGTVLNYLSSLYLAYRVHTN
jgi:hypothetical protein